MSEPTSKSFIHEIVEADLKSGRYDGIVTRFPPEPNGYLHIGHAKSIALNFGLARDYRGVFHLRFDDSNPATEDPEYVESIQRDARWLGADWGDKLYFASDYFDRLYEYACELIRMGKAYVCSLSEEEVRAYRGTISEAGRPSPGRGRTIEENLDLFRRMKDGEFPDGAHTLRAAIDMASPNMKMRDPPLYRIRHHRHYRQGDRWSIYPLYDFIHCLSDSIEGITHSICTLEFENNRELYDWILDTLKVTSRPHQYEFARLNLTYTVLSKRKLLQLVGEGHVSGWDDPRMPTVAAFRRRGVRPEALRAFCERIGVAKNNSTVDVALLEHAIRDDLDAIAPRVMGVLDPLEVVIETWPEGEVETLTAPSFPPELGLPGSRRVPMSRTIFIERDDFMEEPAPKYHRLSPGREVRLRNAYVIRCEQVVKDATGRVVQLRCSHDPGSRGGAGAKVKGIIHWVSAAHAVPAEVRLYDRLFKVERPGEGDVDFLTELNPDSLTVRREARLEPSMAEAVPGHRVQLERHGFFAVDPIDSRPGALVLNRIVSLKDSWARASAGPRAEAPPPRAEPKAAPVEARARDLIAEDPALAALVRAALAVCSDERLVRSWATNELQGALRGRSLDSIPLDGGRFGALVALVAQSAIGGTSAKEVLDEMLETGAAPDAIVERRGLRQVSDAGAIGALVDRILAAHPEEVQRFRAGEKKLQGFLLGQVMRESGAKANPKVVAQLLGERLA